MKKRWLLLLALPLAVLVACGPSAAEKENVALKQQVQELKARAGAPPAGLDNLYPPKAPAPLLAIQMLQMAMTMESMMADLMQQDFPNVQANYAKFKDEYNKMAQTATQAVPEWKDMFPTAPVEALGAALQSGDPAKVQQAMGGLTQACDSCHNVYFLKVQLKYRWPDFSKVMVTDPLTGQTAPFMQFMFSVGGAFAGIGNDLQQGQLDNARKNFEAFNTRFGALRQSCASCHATPRTYYVDPGIQGMIDKLGTEIKSPSPNPQTIGQLMQGIGQESCTKCHSVHFPAAKIRNTWQEVK